MEKLPSVAAYVRVSTEDQAEQGLSIPNQKSRLKAYCQSQNWHIFNFYIDDGRSGKDLERPGIQQILQEISEGKIDTVLVLKLDRLSRRQKDVLYLIEDVFEPNSTRFVSATENFDTSTPFGRAMLSMLAVFAQLERDTIIQRSKWGKLEAAKAGRWQGGQVYGYMYIPGTYKLQPTESEAQVVRQVFDLYETYGMRKIADMLNENKIPSPRGKRWSHELISYILTNPVYIGKIRHLGKDYKAMHEPIITQEQWNKAQATYERRQKFKIRRYGDSLIAGLVFCGECGARMRYKTVKQKYPKKNPRTIHYFVCYSQHDKGRGHMSRTDFCDCGYKHVNEIEEKVINQIHNISINEELLRNEIEKEVSSTKSGNGQIDSQMARSKKELNGIESALNRWYDAFEHGALDPAELTERVQQLKDKRNRLEEHIEILRGKLQEEKQQSIHAENVIAQIRNFNKIWSESKYDERKEIIQGLVKKVEVFKSDETRVEFDL